MTSTDFVRTATIPLTRDGMCRVIHQAMAADPSGLTLADLVLAYLGLARSEATIQAIDRTDRAITDILARNPTWSAQL